MLDLDGSRYTVSIEDNVYCRQLLKADRILERAIPMYLGLLATTIIEL